jgi:hypothetical protein
VSNLAFGGTSKVNFRGLSIFLALFILVSMPANAYADPSGGSLFQILMPTLAALWAMWMILANRVRNAVIALYRKVRGVAAEETSD